MSKEKCLALAGALGLSLIFITPFIAIVHNNSQLWLFYIMFLAFLATSYFGTDPNGV